MVLFKNSEWVYQLLYLIEGFFYRIVSDSREQATLLNVFQNTSKIYFILTVGTLGAIFSKVIHGLVYKNKNKMF
jgi:hypothetical protein